MSATKRGYRCEQAGISLVELILFIVIVGVGLSGILSVLDISNKASTDPLLRKQALAIAEALLEEIQLKPFTYCDPDDANALTAASSAGCAVVANNQSSLPLGPQPGEDRYSAATPFDNVSDYAGFSMSGIRSIHDGATVIPGLAGYNAQVTLTQSLLNATGGAAAVPAEAALRIDVRITHGSQVDLTLTGYRLRYAPHASQ